MENCGKERRYGQSELYWTECCNRQQSSSVALHSSKAIININHEIEPMANVNEWMCVCVWWTRILSISQTKVNSRSCLDLSFAFVAMLIYIYRLRYRHTFIANSGGFAQNTRIMSRPFELIWVIESNNYITIYDMANISHDT